MAIDEELKRQLVAELCAIIDGWDQYHAGSMLGIRQPRVSALRHGRIQGFSSDRLLLMVANCHYDIEVVLREMRAPYAKPRVEPKVTVQRIDRNGAVIACPPMGEVKRFRRPSGEFEAVGDWNAWSPARTHDSRFDIDDE
jgi:predicted XRE-type DNA-binding protein